MARVSGSRLQVKVFITPRKGILDPQGRAVEGSLKSLGFEGVASVRVGRYISIDIDAHSNAEAEATIKKMCDQLLANPNIEDYRFDLDPDENAKPEPVDKFSISPPTTTRKFRKMD
jgi:phosphoribosylformylglycinamidine synthase PurS subunit